MGKVVPGGLHEAELAGPTGAAPRTPHPPARPSALALARDHQVPDDLYRSAIRAFGEKGLVDFAVLAGCYHLVCGVLNLFAVPAPSTSVHHPED
jgi:4-carboxymuconolactone decarboxylase